MALSWGEIRRRALEFSREWADASRENADAKSFWDAFFQVFGVNRRRVAAFEHYVGSKGGDPGYIDLFWPGVLIAEHKSRGKNLSRAYDQALDYFPGIPDADLPRYVVVSDFASFRIHDLDTNTSFSFNLESLHENIQGLGFIAGYEQRVFREQDPVNVKAAEKLARLHDSLQDSGYTSHKLEVFIVRVLFCLFAEDTGIFLPRGAFQDYIESCTREDGSDLGARLNELFDVLDTPESERQKARDERLLAFPHVNGRLFRETLRSPAFDAPMRENLIDCCRLDWGQISPAVFGSLFQGIMDPEARRNLGAHYTSEKNILKAIGPLFMDDLRAEFSSLKARRSNDRTSKLRQFHDKLAGLNFLDPACGCGNFLVIAYREIRQLELQVISELFYRDNQQLALDAIDQYVKVNVDQFHGIEIEEWPAQIAQVAMWLMDHQMNLSVSKALGDAFVRVPLVKSANIVHGNALRLDWNQVLPASRCSYVFGNPPFVGAKLMDREQRGDALCALRGLPIPGVLDFVAAWYVRATRYISANRACPVAFVSTNSITQGEQVYPLWVWMLEQGATIHFAHRTFAWTSEARGKAAVHCVIIGFGLTERKKKSIFEYAHLKAEPHEVAVERINPYLTAGPYIALKNRNEPICEAPKIGIGNKPIDGGNYLFTTEQKEEFISREPSAAPYFRRWIGSREFLNNVDRWCLWLRECPPEDLRRMPAVLERVEAVRQFRRNSRSAPTRKLADRPTRFHVENVPQRDYLVIPEVSSERRDYIPIGFFGPEVLASNLVKVVNDAQPYHFGVLSSLMHMSWIRAVCGRLKSDFRYSSGIVYNNFPWPEPTTAQKEKVESAARRVLEYRALYPRASLADLYDPLAMPDDLLKAHYKLDQAVDAAYGVRSASSKWKTEAERVGFLFQLYEGLA